MNRSFADLKPSQALRAAIAIERRNTELYRNLAETFDTYHSPLSALFTALAEEEIQHQRELEDHLLRHFPGDSPAEDVMIEEAVEAPDLDDPEGFIFDNLTVEQALGIAERAEAQARNFYKVMAHQVRDEGLRALCQHLVEVESRHEQALAQWKKTVDCLIPRP